MEGVICSYAQESVIRNIINSERMCEYYHKLSKGVDGIVILEIETPEFTYKWAFRRNGTMDTYYWGAKYWEVFRNRWYGK